MFAEGNGGVEGQDIGLLGVLADVALQQDELEEDQEDEPEEAPQEMEEEEKVAHDYQSPGEIWPLSEDASNRVYHHYAHYLKFLGIQALLLPGNSVVSTFDNVLGLIAVWTTLPDWCNNTVRERFIRRTSSSNN